MTLRKLLTIVAAVAAVSFAAGCYSTPVMPPPGIIYSGFEAPLNASGGESGNRKGIASCSAVLGLYAWGDCSTAAAASAGGITEVKRLDYRYLNAIFIYQRLTTVVYGD